MRVGLAMIVKNEEEVIGRCLDSVRDAFDEIVIVDTGSTDATKEVARRYTDRVLDFAWVDDFAAARNFSFARVSADWICWLDADDVMLHAEHLRDVLADLEPGVGGLAVPYDVQRDKWNPPRWTHGRLRCVRKDGGFVWDGFVHERLENRQGRPIVRVEAVQVEHRHERATFQRDPGRYIRYMTSRRAANDATLQFLLGVDLAGAGDVDDAMVAFQRCVAIPGWEVFHYWSWIWLGRLHRAAGRNSEATESFLRSLKVLPTWPDAYFNLAELAYHRQDWDAVIYWTDIGRTRPVPDIISESDPYRYASDWIVFYVVALHHVGRVVDALAWTRVGLGYDPDNEWHRANLRSFNAILGAAALAVGPADQGLDVHRSA